jgi:DNA invertase Pin-like site-specific DNA recombinase
MAQRNYTIGEDGEARIVTTAPRRGGGTAPGPRYALLYLRLSDLDHEAALTGRADRLRKLAAAMGYVVPPGGVRVENDMDGDRPKPASAFKRKRVVLTMDDGQTEVVQYRVIRPVFQGIMRELASGTAHAMLAEDLDRICRDPRDLEDCIDVVEYHKAVIASVTPGQINLTTGDGITMARVLVAFANQSSRATARRVADSHDRLFGKTHRGGDGGYGFRADPDAPKYAKRLVHEPAEAEVILEAYEDILDRDLGLAAVAKELRRRRVKTRRGGTWTPSTLRGVLLKPAVAGYDLHHGTMVRVSWIEPIVTRERWHAMIGKLDAADRKRGPKPAGDRRYMLSGIARCGVCGMAMTGSRRNSQPGRAPWYVAKCHHVTRSVDRVERQVGRLVVARLEMPDAVSLLRPPPPLADAETARWEAERRRVKRLIREKNELHSAGLIEMADLTPELTELRERLADAEAALAAPSAPDPLEEFRGRPAAEVWDTLGPARRRAVVKLLVTRVTVARAKHGARWHEDPDLIQVEWHDATRPKRVRRKRAA